MAGILPGLHWRGPDLFCPALMLSGSLVLLWAAYRLTARHWHSGMFGMAAYIFLFFAGMFSAQLHRGYSVPFPPEDREIFAGKLLERPVDREKTVRALLAVVPASLPGKQSRPVMKVYAYFPRDSGICLPERGEVILFSGRISAPAAPMNPCEFDYASYLFHQGISGQVFLDAGDWKTMGRHDTGSLLSSLAGWRYRLLDRLKNTGMGEREYQVLSALTLGYRDELDHETRTRFSRAGAMHFLAISGLHVGILYLLLGAVFSFMLRIPHGRSLRAFVILVLLWGYAFLSGMSPSVSRAVTMFSFFAVGSALGRPAGGFNILAASAFMLLLLQPFLLADVGFQLSYLAVGGIMLFQPRIYRLAVPGNAWLDRIWVLTTVALAAQLATFPLTIHYFNLFPSYFLLSNLMVLPLVTVLLGTGVVFFLTGWIGPAGHALAWVLEQLTRLMNQAVALVDSLPGSVISPVYLDPYRVILLYGALATAFLFLLSRKRPWFLALLLLVLIYNGYAQALAWKHDRQSLFIVYRVPGGTMAGVVGGRTCWVDVRNDGGTLFPYQTQNHRLSLGIRRLIRADDPSGIFPAGILATDYGWFIQGRSKRIGITRPQPDRPLPCGQKLELDILLVTTGSGWRPRELLDCFDAGLVVLDGSLGYAETQRWINMLEDRGVACFSVYRQGAFRIEL